MAAQRIAVSRVVKLEDWKREHEEDSNQGPVKMVSISEIMGNNEKNKYDPNHRGPCLISLPEAYMRGKLEDESKNIKDSMKGYLAEHPEEAAEIRTRLENNRIEHII